VEVSCWLSDVRVGTHWKAEGKRKGPRAARLSRDGLGEDPTFLLKELRTLSKANKAE
jgi:hypothetical protein